MAQFGYYFKRAYWTFVAAGSVYALFIICLLNPWIQRHSLYAHKINSLHFEDIHTAEAFGFARNQVTPFNITTSDGETIYAWHILPLNLYTQHEESLLKRQPGLVEDFRDTLAFDLLTKDPESKVVINFHGNAGDVAQGWRPDTYRSLTSLPKTHVLTIDYRGFGYSTGFPTEEGLITDGIAIVSWALDVAQIPPERIAIVGQSLGTAVASAVALRFAEGTVDKPTYAGSPDMPDWSIPLPGEGSNNYGAMPPAPPAASDSSAEDLDLETTETLITSDTSLSNHRPPIDFAGVLLIASFSNLPVLMLTYRISGVVPILSPLRPYPWIQRFISNRIVDTWDTSTRLAQLVQVTAPTDPAKGVSVPTQRRLKLTLLHARNDWDIPFRHSVANFERCRYEMGLGRWVWFEHEGYERGNVDLVEIKGKGGRGWRDTANVGDGRDVRLEVVEYGGHNRIVSYAPVALAVARMFEM